MKKTRRKKLLNYRYSTWLHRHLNKLQDLIEWTAREARHYKKGATVWNAFQRDYFRMLNLRNRIQNKLGLMVAEEYTENDLRFSQRPEEYRKRRIYKK